MPTITHEILIHAPPQICFDLARSVEAHLHTSARTRERAVGGVTTGLLSLGDQITWEAVHFGVKQRLTAEIIAMDEPSSFVDRMVPGQGAFQSFTHTHQFAPHPDGTLMRDRFVYKSPLGLLGRLADALFLRRYMHRFIASRAKELKRMAEDRQKWPTSHGAKTICRWTHPDQRQRIYLVLRDSGTFSSLSDYFSDDPYEMCWLSHGVAASYYDSEATALRELTGLHPWIVSIKPEISPTAPHQF